MHKVWHRTNMALKFGHFDHVTIVHDKYRVHVEVPRLMYTLCSVGVVVVIVHCIDIYVHFSCSISAWG